MNISALTAPDIEEELSIVKHLLRLYAYKNDGDLWVTFSPLDSGLLDVVNWDGFVYRLTEIFKRFERIQIITDLNISEAGDNYCLAHMRFKAKDVATYKNRLSKELVIRKSTSLHEQCWMDDTVLHIKTPSGIKLMSFDTTRGTSDLYKAFSLMFKYWRNKRSTETLSDGHYAVVHVPNSVIEKHVHGKHRSISEGWLKTTMNNLSKKAEAHGLGNSIKFSKERNKPTCLLAIKEM